MSYALNSTNEIQLKTAISFKNEHGIFLRNKTMKKLKFKKGDTIGIEHAGLIEFEVCREFDEINIQAEATALMALFEVITSDHYVFLSEHGLTEKIVWKSSPFPFALKEICPGLHVERDSLFVLLYKKIEDALIELDLLDFSQKREIPKATRVKLEESKIFVESMLKKLYDDADCVLGIGSFLSFITMKPLELCFGTCGLPTGRISKLLNERLLVNPYLLYWVLDACGRIKGGKINFTYPTISILGKLESVTPLDSVNLKVYFPSTDLTPWGADATWLNRYIHQSLMREKPYILKHDLLLPFTCPSMVIRLNYRTEAPSDAVATPYGQLIIQLETPKVMENTKINVEFFDYPLYNKQCPVVLDTSAVDVARFPLRPEDHFFDMFLEGREIIIPSAVLYELRTRYPTQDKRRVSEALTRINCLKSWGFIKDLRYQKSLPLEMIRTVKGKKKIEDLADFMVLATAIKNKGILFTNDKELGTFAFLNGVYVISYTSLEDDVMRVISEHSGEYSTEDIVEAVQDYGLKTRGHKYEEADIQQVINLGIKRRDVQEIKGKLFYTGPKRRKIKPLK